MRVITIEDHFETPLHRSMHPPMTPPRETVLAGQSKRLGHDVAAELLDLGVSRLAAMDAAGIDFQVVSHISPGVESFDAATAVPMAEDANDRLYEAIGKHPTRLGGFAALPLADPSAALKEFERAVTRLGFKGALINGHTRGQYLDDHRYWDIFAYAQEKGVPVYLHPTDPHPQVMKAYFDGHELMSRAAWGFAVETGTHFLRLLYAGLFDRFPSLRIVLGHLGEGLPFWMQRLDNHSYVAAAQRGLRKRPAQYLRENLVITTSGNCFTPAFLCCLLALGADNILFSVDWPYETNFSASEFLRQLPVSEQDRHKIAHANAERLLKL